MRTHSIFYEPLRPTFEIVGVGDLYRFTRVRANQHDVNVGIMSKFMFLAHIFFCGLLIIFTVIELFEQTVICMVKNQEEMLILSHGFLLNG